MAAKQTLTLRRRGEFKFKTSGDNHCGIMPDQLVRYAVEVECTPKLDHRGFLFEQREVDAYMQKHRKVAHSCETLSIKCAKGLRKLILAENPGCQIQKIVVNLCADPFAADMTYTWSP